MRVKIGTAGWSIPRECAAEFGPEGTSLSRYADRFCATEINSSFHRSHRLSTWERWYDSVPAAFRFSVKLPKSITHSQKLVDCSGLVDAFLEEVTSLREKLAVLLVQLPPKLAFDPAIASQFFTSLVARSETKIACEPRHFSWFTSEAENLLARIGIARVAADPAICAAASVPGGWSELRYWRLHGSPDIYRSSYLDRIEDYAARLLDDADERDIWCIFDNTASSAGAGDALALTRAISREAGDNPPGQPGVARRIPDKSD